MDGRGCAPPEALKVPEGRAGDRSAASPQVEVVRSVEPAAYTVATDRPEADGTLSWDSTTLVLVSVAAGGRTGVGWTYGPAACAAVVADLLAPVVCGRDAMDVPAAWQAMVRQLRNAGRQGMAGYALSAVDAALWDLKARLLGQPLYRLLGAAREQVPVYGSGGFTSYDDDATREQLGRWAGGQRIPRVKIKIGEARGGREDRDLHRVRLAREVVGPGVELYVDANGGYRRKQALRVAGALADLGVRWFEEPVSSDDLAGLRLVRDRFAADVAAGEYGFDLPYFRRMCQAGAVDCLQVDATRCGGLTEWFRAAAVAAAHGLEVSAHCAPHLHAHAAAATLNLRHIEWFHDHVRVESMLFDGCLDPAGGTLRPDPDRPGHGLAFRHADAERYRVR